MDDFDNFEPALTSPAACVETIIPSDTNDLVHVTRGLYVGFTGDVAVRMKSGELATFSNVQGGTTLALRIERIFATGTTATGLVGLR